MRRPRLQECAAELCPHYPYLSTLDQDFLREASTGPEENEDEDAIHYRSYKVMKGPTYSAECLKRLCDLVIFPPRMDNPSQARVYAVPNQDFRSVR